MLVAAIRRAMRGESVVAEEMTGKLVAAFRGAWAAGAGRAGGRAGLAARPLSPREREILRGIARREQQGDRPHLGIAETTVKIHVQHVLRKLDVKLARAGCGDRHRARVGLSRAAQARRRRRSRAPCRRRADVDIFRSTRPEAGGE